MNPFRLYEKNALLSPVKLPSYRWQAPIVTHKSKARWCCKATPNAGMMKLYYQRNVTHTTTHLLGVQPMAVYSNVAGREIVPDILDCPTERLVAFSSSVD